MKNIAEVDNRPRHDFNPIQDAEGAQLTADVLAFLAPKDPVVVKSPEALALEQAEKVIAENPNFRGIHAKSKEIMGGDDSEKNLIKDALVTVQATQLARDKEGNINQTDFNTAYTELEKFGTSTPWIEQTVGKSEPQWIKDEKAKKIQEFAPAGTVVVFPSQSMSSEPSIKTAVSPRS